MATHYPPVVIVTGCSSGIGQALALAFRHHGYRVYATARRPEDLAQLGALGLQALPLDVCDPASRAAFWAALDAQEDHVDILINNAGYGAMGPTVEMPETELERQFATNVFAPLLMAQAAATRMRPGGGRIVNIGSVSGVLTTPFAGVYCATKAALHSLSDALRMELAPFGIAVITIQPGAIRSRFGDHASEAVERVLRADSWYDRCREAIYGRARASQRRATSAETFARICYRAVTAPRPRAMVRIGNGSSLMPLLARLPIPWRDRLLRRQFGLQFSAIPEHSP